MNLICWMLVAALATAGGSAVADRPLIVLDPGHGGTNTGAPGVGGVYEKQATLRLARCVGERLREQGLRVALTREDDRYLSLRQRVRYANELGADRFVSIHFNATEDHDQRGFETYILTARAVDVDGRALRVEDGAPREGVAPETARLLDDVERGLALPESAELALSIQKHLRAVRGEETDRGVRQESMHVLLGATMPAALVEVGFIDHPVEGPELLDPDMQQQLCAALADAIAGDVTH